MIKRNILVFANGHIKSAVLLNKERAVDLALYGDKAKDTFAFQMSAINEALHMLMANFWLGLIGTSVKNITK